MNRLRQAFRSTLHFFARANASHGTFLVVVTVVLACLIGTGFIATISPVYLAAGPRAEPRSTLPTTTPGDVSIVVATAPPTDAPPTDAPPTPTLTPAPPTPTAQPDLQKTTLEAKPQPTPTPTPTTPPPTIAPPVQSKALIAVLIVGPSDETTTNILRAEEVAQHAERYGMEVRRVYHPHATWSNVLANIQGANLVVYMGHGNGWPSPYGSFQEQTKDGFGLDSFDGASTSDMTYYGASDIKKKIKLAPNAIVALNHLCYSAGNAEPGFELPTYDVARQRVDNYASGFLAAGARAVFAYGSGPVTPIVDALFQADSTMDKIFTTSGIHRRAYYGFIGWDDRYFDSQRTPGYRNHLDPGQTEGFLRALTGDLEMTTAEWMGRSP